MRAAGFITGLITALMDIFKAASTVWITRAFAPESHVVWASTLAPVFAIIGHNYSIFLIHRDKSGKVKLGGGAGGACSVGGSFGLWAPSLPIIFIIGALVFYFIGYASVTTMTVAFLSIIIFSILALLEAAPWQYIIFGVLAQVLLIWSLRGNIGRLLEGTERLHGFRAQRKRKTQAQSSPSNG
jgi:glycerol-3-phosphate acyltransferase PlsY